MSIGNRLFADVVAASGLSPMFAERSIARACAKIAVDPSRVSVSDLGRLLPAIEPILSMYLDEDQHAAARAALSQLKR